MNKLLELRKKHKLKQSEVAVLLNISQANYSLIESNKIKLQLEQAKILSSLYKVPIDYLVNNNKNVFSLTDEEIKTLKEASLILQKFDTKKG